MSIEYNPIKFKVGDLVKPHSNFEDEQLGHQADMSTQTVTNIRSAGSGTSGLWIKTNKTKDWVDAWWFDPAEKE